MTPLDLLIVDDEEAIRESISWYLEDALADAPVRIRCSASAEAALSIFAGRADAPLAVVSDYNLGPGAMDGLTFLEKVMGLYPESRRVLMSGYGIADLARANLHAVDVYLPKPFNAPDLLAAIWPTGYSAEEGPMP